MPDTRPTPTSTSTPTRWRRGRCLVLGVILLIAGCGPSGEGRPTGEGARESGAPATRLAVVATFTILADMVANVGGDRVEITTLVGPDSDAHVFSPTPAAARAIAGARLVFVNGLGFEGWIDKLIVASGYQGKVVVASEGVDTLKLAAQPHAGHSHAHRHDPADVDPHAWQSLSNARRYVQNIADALAGADPANGPEYRARAQLYVDSIERLDAAARARLGAIPVPDRRVIVGHDAFGYFARAYDITFLSPRGLSTDSEASARDVARLVRQIREQRIRAVFVENISDPRLIEQLARESGARVGGTLFSDALSARDRRALTYLDMMRHNIDEVAKALAPALPGT